jgi:hypothetical protein
MRIAIDKNKKDLYANPFPYQPFEIPKGSLNKLPPQYKASIDKLFHNIKEHAQKVSVANITKSALTQTMNDLVEKIPLDQPFDKVVPLRKEYIADKLGRLTKQVLIITSENKSDAEEILKPIEPITESLFNENIKDVVEDISKEDLKIEVG